MEKNEPGLKSLRDPLLKEAHAKIMRALTDENIRISFYGTGLACAKLLGDYLLTTRDLKEIPRDIQYILAQTWNQYALVFTPSELLEIPSLDFQNYFESGSLDDRFATVVKQLYDICKRERLL